MSPKSYALIGSGLECGVLAIKRYLKYNFVGIIEVYYVGAVSVKYVLA
jgi:hypothetical protein